MITTNSVYFIKQRIFLFTVFKRVIDIVGSSILLLIFSPILIISSILIKLTSPGPIFFSQKRVGQNSRQFSMYKFRTMYTGNNDEKLKQYPELWEKYKEAGWKLSIKEDPRITSIGKYLRTLSIDEMPQFINVLKGDMSLVGPRAYREEELQEYEKKFPQTAPYINDIRSVKPGITGLWQTSGRNDLSFEKRAKLDSHYIQTRSLRQELLILLKTPFCMISRW
jgi:exopolysaccharide production protein ExoY